MKFFDPRKIASHGFAAATLAFGLMLAPQAAHAQGVWHTRYSGDANARDVPYAAVPDGRGDIIVTGQSTTNDYGTGISTVKYDASGQQVWAHAEAVRDSLGYDKRIGSSLAAIDKSTGNVTVLGERLDDNHATVATYTPGGERIRLLDLALLTYGPELSGLQLYPNGDFSVTGYTYYSIDDGDSQYATWYVARYTHSGKLLWSDLYSGSPDPRNSGEVNIVAGAQVDSRGDLVVAGTYETSSPNVVNVVVRKYDPSGKVLYSTQLRSGNSTSAGATSFTLDSQDNAYVAGNINFTAPTGGLLLAKFSPNGKQLWQEHYGRQFSDGSEGMTYAQQVVIDHSGNAIVAGNVYVQTASGDYYEQRVLAKYDPTGNRFWVRRYSKTSNDLSYNVNALFASSVSDDFYSVDTVGNSISASYPYSSVVVTSKFGPDGYATHEEDYLGDPGSTYTVATGAAFDPSTNSVFVLDGDFGDEDFDNEDWMTLEYQLGG